MSEFLTIGEPVVTFMSKDADASLVDTINYFKLLGGAELNVAIGVQRLGHTTEYVSRLGADPLGGYAKKQILEHGVGTTFVTEDADNWTGFQLKQMVTTGDPQTFNYRTGSAAAHLSSDVLDDVKLDDVKIAHMSGIFPALSETSNKAFRHLMDRLVAADKLITFDPNLRPALWNDDARMIREINEFAKSADIILPGNNEGKILMGSEDPKDIADFYLNQSERTKVVIVKVGPAGAYVQTRDTEGFMVPGFKVAKVVDTVGAGDGFALGVITALLEDKSLRAATMRGNAIGALQVQTPGDNDGYPTPAQLAAFYATEGVSED